MFIKAYPYKRILNYNNNALHSLRIFNFWKRKWLYFQLQFFNKFKSFLFMWKKRFFSKYPFKTQQGYFVNLLKSFYFKTFFQRKILKKSELKHFFTTFKTKKIYFLKYKKKLISFNFFHRLYSKIEFILFQSQYFSNSKELRFFLLYNYIFKNNQSLQNQWHFCKKGDLITFDYKLYKYIYNSLLSKTSLNFFLLRQTVTLAPLERKERIFSLYKFLNVEQKEYSFLSLKK